MRSVADVAVPLVSVYLSTVLVYAGLAKLTRPQAFELFIVRLLPLSVWRGRLITSRSATVAVSVVEVSLGILLVAKPTPLVFVAVTGTFAAFTGITAWAVTRRLACGCSGSFRPTTKWTLVERVVQAGVAAILVAHALLPTRFSAAAAVAAAITVLALVATTLVRLLWSRFARAYRARLSSETGPFRNEPLAVGDASRMPSRRQFLRLSAAAAAAAFGASLGLARNARSAGAQWIWLQPNDSATTPGESRPMWVDYGGVWNPYAWVNINWGDGTASGAYANYYDIQFFHTWSYQGDYWVNATVPDFSLSDWSLMEVAYDKPDVCWRLLLACDRCCQNSSDWKGCSNCCVTCHDRCGGSNPCAANSCYSCYNQT
jgi:hypothetical protein